MLAAIALLLPAFAQVAEFGAGRDRRFAEAGFRIEELAAPVLPLVCREQAGRADAAVRERLCPVAGPAPAASAARIPPSLADALARSTRAFLAPLNEAAARLAALRQRQHKGSGDLRALADATAAIEADIQPFVERFQLGNAGASGPLPLVCAGRWIEALAAQPAATGDLASARANGLLLLAAALDGRSEVEGLAGAAALPALAASATTPPAGPERTASRPRNASATFSPPDDAMK